MVLYSLSTHWMGRSMESWVLLFFRMEEERLGVPIPKTMSLDVERRKPIRPGTAGGHTWQLKSM